MAKASSNVLHPRWGRPLSLYPESYTNIALADRLKVPVKAADRVASRTIALTAIEEICTLNESTLEPDTYNNIVENITLLKLESILQLTRFPDEYENLALPMLVAGCTRLLSCVAPSPFACEYGYLCFRTLIFALNMCLLKHGEDWDEILDLMKSMSPSQRLTHFWDQCAHITFQENLHYYAANNMTQDTHDAHRGRWCIPHFDFGKLDELVSVLDSDRKNFLVALRDTGSLGLSTLCFITRKHIETKKCDMSNTEYIEKALLPYCRVFYRYQVALPDFIPERFISRHISSADMKSLQDESFIDIDDSRNILRAYIDSVQSPGELMARDRIPLNFFMPHVVPGCEDLIPDMFEATIRFLWNNILVQQDLDLMDHFLRKAMHDFCCILSHLEAQVTVSRTIPHSWIFKLVDKIIENDTVGLLLRATLLKSTPEPDDLECNKFKAQDRRTSSQKFLNLATFVPLDYLTHRLNQSGCLGDWWKYFMHFIMLAPGGIQMDPSHPGFTMQGFAAQLICTICLELLGIRFEDAISRLQEHSKMCRNPRCPAPFGPGLTSTKRALTNSNGPYCGMRCMEIFRVASLPA
ncbi:hypothetical protein V565_104380 [Rhizoctonia solani 123E]|uniref:Uncharacterized protein n=2 Tax=Rhizoctonia solani AG-3 TaxID=1086053 RepID=A0A074RQF5_9AGAM|nr:hypothetical protein V565_104380 [Rhizoctonia solani 123E]